MTNQPIQKIIFGSPGTGKSHLIKSEIIPDLIKDEDIDKQEKKRESNVIHAVFHPEYTFGDFIGKLLPISTKSGSVEYRFYEGHFLKALAQAYKNIIVAHDTSGKKISEPENVVLVIDEINRGNSSSIFGSIFQLLDREEDGWSSYKTTIHGIVFLKLFEMVGFDIASTTSSGEIATVKLPLLGSKAKTIDDMNDIMKEIAGFDLINKTIKIPPNLHIIATMNTSDNSIYHMDTAFKRRWDWEFIDIDSKTVAEPGIAFYYNSENEKEPENKEYFDFIQKLNYFIKSNHNYIRGVEDKQIGRYFIKGFENQISYTVVQSKLMFFIWDSVFNRDKKPLADLLGVSKDELVTFGDFALKVKSFIKAIQER